MIILGIDPGMAIIGYGIIDTQTVRNKKQNYHQKPRVVDFGCITTDKKNSAPERLYEIHQKIGLLIEKYKPNIISLENLFFFKNVKTALPVSQAKGVIMLSAAQKNIPIIEFTPLQVKMAVVGYGNASKKQVQEMTKKLLDLNIFNPGEKGRRRDDASDALGVALCAFLKTNYFKLK